MYAWIKRHPLLLCLSSLCLFVLIGLGSLFYPGYREQAALAAFQRNNPDIHFYNITYEGSHPKIGRLLDEWGLQNYMNRVVKMSITGDYAAGLLFKEEKNLEYLQAFPHLRDLTLMGLRLTPEEFSRVRFAHNLKILRVENCWLRDDGTMILENMPHLRSVHANYFRIQHTRISQLPRLRELDLKNCGAGDTVLESLDEISDTLQILGIANSQVTDDGLRHLLDMKKLKFIDLRHTRRTESGYPPYTWQGIAQLKDHHSLGGVGLRHTFDADQLEQLKAVAPRFVTRWDDPVPPSMRKDRILPQQ
ncbi:MAG: hypothetical protein KDA78_06460 [Planctomycetaceae bacterium]|nr:hypothetical protein [Planctomycetaceae bacterium]